MNNITLKEYLVKHDLKISDLPKHCQKFLKNTVVKEISSIGMDWDDFQNEISQTRFPTRNQIYEFIVLSNGIAIGMNRNKNIGTPTIASKYYGDLNIQLI